MSSIKEEERYRNIGWLMPSVDVFDVLERLGAEQILTQGDEVGCLCPDHRHFVGRDSSHPNWSCNVITGQTNCFTEPRGSNLIWTVCRVLKCAPADAVYFITGKDVASLTGAALLNRIGRNKRVEEKKVIEPVRLEDILKDLENPQVFKRGYRYFIQPSNKTPTDIQKETVDKYKVIERCWGYFSNRAIIPFFMFEKLVGFVAVDLLGKKEWLEEHPLKEESEYRKVLYPKYFIARECLFGYDDCEKGCDYLIVTEGSREVMKLWQEGFTNSVGCLKADLSAEQILLITKLSPKKIVLMFDGDDAGWSATDKNEKKLSPLFEVVSCYLPSGKDPKDLNKKEIHKIINKKI